MSDPVQKRLSARRVPPRTSAGCLALYVPGEVERESTGPAWRELQARVLSQDRGTSRFSVPAVEETSLILVRSGAGLLEEREPGGKWTACSLGPGSLFLTAPGAAYELRLRLEAPAPLVTFQTLVGLPLLAKAAEEIFGGETVPRLESRSCFRDAFLETTLSALETELERGERASELLVTGLGQALAVHLVRRHALGAEEPARKGGLPGHLLRRLAVQMKRELSEPFSLVRYAGLAGMSQSHLSRAFKQSTGLAPSRYAIRLRIEEARRLLRETDESVVQIGLAVGYASPSHFAQVFRRETGLSPVAYRRRF